MKTVEVKITSSDEHDASGNSVHIESRRGDVWNRDNGKDIVTNKDGVQKFNLRAGQRLVVEAFPSVTEQPVYDRAQGAAVLASAQKSGEPKADNPKPDGPTVSQTAKQEEQRLAKAAESMGLQADTSSKGGSPTKPGVASDTKAKPHPNPEPFDSTQSMKPAGTENPDAEPNPRGGAGDAVRAGSTASNKK
jgi:hypothetical protein